MILKFSNCHVGTYTKYWARNYELRNHCRLFSEDVSPQKMKEKSFRALWYFLKNERPVPNRSYVFRNQTWNDSLKNNAIEVFPRQFQTSRDVQMLYDSASYKTKGVKAKQKILEKGFVSHDSIFNSKCSWSNYRTWNKSLA